MINKEKLTETRHAIELYTIEELASMFGIGRSAIDYAINTKQLKYMSPNNKTRFIKLQDFLEYSKKRNDTCVYQTNDVVSQMLD